MNDQTQRMEYDESMEMLCEKIRRGEPVGFLKAIAAINYYEERKQYAAENTLWRRLVRRIAAFLAANGGG